MASVGDFVQIYLINVDILAAHDIEKADTFGKSDPYVRVTAFQTSYQTATIMKTLNPVWKNEHVEMTFFNDPKQIKFELFDYDGNPLAGKDDGIGDCVFNLTPDFYDPSTPCFQGKIKLQNCKKGELEIKIEANKLVPAELEKRTDDLQNLVESNTNSIEELDLTIKDWNEKNTALNQEIDSINTNITNLTAEIPTLQQELKDKETKGINNIYPSNSIMAFNDISISANSHILGPSIDFRFCDFMTFCTHFIRGGIGGRGKERGSRDSSIGETIGGFEGTGKCITKGIGGCSY